MNEAEVVHGVPHLADDEVEPGQRLRDAEVGRDRGSGPEVLEQRVRGQGVNVLLIRARMKLKYSTSCDFVRRLLPITSKPFIPALWNGGSR